MEKRILGKTGLEVSRLGVGLAEIGFGLTLAEALEELHRRVERLGQQWEQKS